MLILNSPEVVQETSHRWKTESKVALVPTMGCLHEGHLQLVKKAQSLADKCIVSIFVNPLQFGPNEDFEKYPRTFEQDVEKLESLKVDLLFYPTVKDFYPEGFGTNVSLPALSQFLCGKSRPGHFDGVATVCLKLFQATMTDFAIFGEKDFQQFRVLEQMVADLNLPLAIVPHPIVREEDGLALSSRNRYLSSEERVWASKIPETVSKVQTWYASHRESTVGELLSLAEKSLTSVPLQIDYVEIASTKNLAPADGAVRANALTKPRLFIAVKAGATRLIDNASLIAEG